MSIGITVFKRETFDSALNLGIEALKLLGNDEAKAQRAAKLFSDHDHESLQILADLWGDDQRYGIAVKQRKEDLQLVLAKDEAELEKLNTCHGAACDKKM